MSDDKKKKDAPGGEEERTVFMPTGGGTASGTGKSNFFESDEPAPPAPTSESPDQPVEAPARPEAAPHEGVQTPAGAAETPAVAESDLSDPEPPPVDPTASDPEPPASDAANEAPAEEPAATETGENSPSAEPAVEPPVNEAPAEEPAAAEPAEEPRTVFAPSPADLGKPAEKVPTAETPPPAEPAPPPPPAEPTPAPSGTSAGTSTGGSTTGFKPVEGARNIQVGDVLNHIFEVKRFLARGGMGEVFEGCNVNTDERVAIKVMLPAMAADEKVVAMFRKEARTLTKLQHEALVSYRVLAQEPQLGALYIVTEFIEGVELGDMLGKVERTPEELAGLLKRLASGLGYAHRLGAIHRDMSPDNVLLPGGDVHQAKIIDFGIAKDLDASSATIVGDGFAGKLNYVAPEQLGDYGREVGPWTDVYSLALVILAVAQGKAVNMSGSLVDAIDKRRKGPDLSAIPAKLKPIIEAMLRPDPKERVRSMEDVLAMLGGERVVAPPPPPPPPPEPEKKTGGSARTALLAGGVAVLLAAGAGAWYAFGGLEPSPGNNVIEPTGDPVSTARNAINAALPSVACTWLDISNVQNGNGGVNVALRGVAGDPDAAVRELNQALTAAGVQNARLDIGDVAEINQAGCAALDTYRQVRATSEFHLTVPQPRFEMMTQPPNTPYAGEEASNAVINFNFSNPNTDFAILGIEPSGVISMLIPDRATFNTNVAQSVDGRPITDDGNGRYRLNIDLDHRGWSGIILVRGQGPFDRDIVAPPVGTRGPSWQQQFLARAAERNWRVEMVWFESVNNQQGDSAPARPAATPAAAPAPAPAGGPAADSADDDKPPTE